MNKITVNKTSQHGIRSLSKKLLKLLDDKESQLYKENVGKFGIPEEYVRKAFSEETLLASATSGKNLFYLALQNGCKILGFAQTIQHDSDMAELDRIGLSAAQKKRHRNKTAGPCT